MQTGVHARSGALDAAHVAVDAAADDAFEAVRDWVRRPSFSDTGEGMLAAAEHTRELLADVAPDAAVVSTAGWPVVLGTVRSKRSDAPTLIVYGLYDVTPTIPADWTVDPLGAHVVDATEIGALAGYGDVLVGRGTSNHKGPVLAAIRAVKALLESTGDVPAHLVFVIEGEEEIGSPSLGGFIDRHRDLLAPAAGVWLPCMQQSSNGTMTLRRAFKGSLFAELECRGGEWGGPADGRHLWAGHSAWLDAPMMRLVKALATLYDDDQVATIDGVEEALEMPADAQSPEVAEVIEGFREHPERELAMLHNLNVRRLMHGRPLADLVAHYMLGTTLNVQGIVGGYDGPAYYTMLPGWARAKLDFRFGPGIAPERFATLVQEHLDRRGYASVRVVNTRGYAGAAAIPEERDTLLAAARVTAQRRGVPVSVWPIANNCSPASLLTGLGSNVPYSIAGTGIGDRAHAPDEFITVGSVRDLMHWTVDYLDDWSRLVTERSVLS
jgi:acetylornithine deacetylase/succinyl-diaminopimelate desuccinylase-like protein